MINNHKENLRKIYSKIFGLNLTESELEKAWEVAKSKRITPMGDRTNIAVSPLMAYELIQVAVGRTTEGIKDKRFKKVREEIIPAVDFALFLKKMGQGEHFIISRDSPDITLLKLEKNQREKIKEYRKIPALPLEVTFIKENTLEDIAGSNINEKIANAIISGKFDKKYEPQTVLLVVLDLESDFNIHLISNSLANHPHNYHDIFIHSQIGETKLSTARIYPSVDIQVYTEEEMKPLLY